MCGIGCTDQRTCCVVLFSTGAGEGVSYMDCRDSTSTHFPSRDSVPQMSDCVVYRVGGLLSIPDSLTFSSSTFHYLFIAAKRPPYHSLPVPSTISSQQPRDLLTILFLYLPLSLLSSQETCLVSSCTFHYLFSAARRQLLIPHPHLTRFTTRFGTPPVYPGL